MLRLVEVSLLFRNLLLFVEKRVNDNSEFITDPFFEELRDC